MFVQQCQHFGGVSPSTMWSSRWRSHTLLIFDFLCSYPSLFVLYLPPHQYSLPNRDRLTFSLLPPLGLAGIRNRRNIAVWVVTRASPKALRLFDAPIQTMVLSRSVASPFGLVTRASPEALRLFDAPIQTMVLSRSLAFPFSLAERPTIASASPLEPCLSPVAKIKLGYPFPWSRIGPT
jgi:hypothetical protein